MKNLLAFFPPYALPLAAAFIIGWVLVLLYPTASLFGLSHHTWTGILFWGAVAAGLLLLLHGAVRPRNLNDRNR